jgi:hypothetical protein
MNKRPGHGENTWAHYLDMRPGPRHVLGLLDPVKAWRNVHDVAFVPSTVRLLNTWVQVQINNNIVSLHIIIMFFLIFHTPVAPLYVKNSSSFYVE